MFGRGLGQRLRPVSRTCSRRFHASPRHQTEAAGNPIVSFIQPWIPVFEHVHDFTAWPWLVSIPAATFLMRAVTTAPRFHLALKRQKRNLKIQHLQLEATIVEQQGRLRLASGIETVEQNDTWKKQTWIRRRDEIAGASQSLEPSRLFSPNSKFDVTNVVNWALVVLNATTLFSLHKMNPTMFELDNFEAFGKPLIFLLFCPLAVLNTGYYQGYSASTIRSQFVEASSNPMKWSESQFRTFTRVFPPPLAAAVLLLDSPAAVMLFALSNSVYTFLERSMFGRFIDTSLPERSVESRTTSQRTRRRTLVA